MSPCSAPTYPVRTVPIAWHKPSWAGPEVPLSTQHWDLVIIASDDLLQARSTGPGKGEADEGRQISQKEGNCNWAVTPAHQDLLLGKLPSSRCPSRNEK